MCLKIHAIIRIFLHFLRFNKYIWVNQVYETVLLFEKTTQRQ